MSSVVSWEWQEHGDAGTWNAYEPAKAEIIEKAFAAKKARVDVDKERFINLRDLVQVRRDNESKTRPVRRVVTTVSSGATPKKSAPKRKAVHDDDTDDERNDERAHTAAQSKRVKSGDDESITAELDASKLRCFEKEVFHFVGKRDRDLEHKIVAHGGELAKSMRIGVTRIVCNGPFADAHLWSAPVVCSRDVHRALAAGGFSRLDSSSTKAPTLKRTRSATKAALPTLATTTTTSAHHGALFGAAPSKLPHSVAEFVSWICEQKDFDEALKRFEIDVSRLLLGSLSAGQLSKGYATLRKIEVVLSTRYSKEDLIGLSNEFYTEIPHAFGRSKPPVIDSLSKVEAKTRLLEALGHMSDASKLALSARRDVVKDDSLDPVIALYKRLDLDLSSSGHATRARVAAYITGTTDVAQHHFTMTIEQVFDVHRHAEAPFVPLLAGSERELMLMHGSRKENMMSILRNGLRIAPPEAPLTGAMFGNGIYMSDCASKSAQYCRSKTRGVLLLCAVRVGDAERRLRALAAPPRAGCHSVFGAGAIGTGPHTVDEVGIEWPGALVPSGIKKGLGERDTDLMFNEYTVYEEARVRIRYAVVVKFNVKDGKSKKSKKKRHDDDDDDSD